MKQIKIELIKELSDKIGNVLIKDLQENERICPTCGGLGIQIANNIFGIKGEGRMFPYKNQSITFCTDCYNGVQRLCKFCGNPVRKGSIDYCECKGYKEFKDTQEKNKYNEIIKNAKEVKESDITTYLYSKELDEYFEDSNSYIDYLHDNNITNKLNHILWVCKEEVLSLDAESLLENACEELHDEAFERINDIEDLQKSLDSFCEKQNGATTYYPCYKEYIIVDIDK